MTNIICIFIKILNMSISASYLIIAVIAARLVLKRAPKALFCALWLLVAVKLVFPFSIKSMFSLVPNTQPIASDIMYETVPEINTGSSIIDTPVNNYMQQNMAPQPQNSVNPLQIASMTGACIWLAGMAVLLGYLVFSTLRLKHKVKDAVPYEFEGIKIYRTDAIDTPFLLGVINPGIYIPYSIKENSLKYVVFHENAHKKRYDYLIKPIGYLLLAVYWFNPIIWAAYCLLCRDIELACDEKVIKDLGVDSRCEYSEALLDCAVSRRTIAACPVAFGEIGIKTRVKNILNYRKPTFWIVTAAVAICVIVPVCFMTQKKDEAQDKDKTRENDISVSEVVNIDDSKVFKLSLPAELAQKMQWKSQDGMELAFYDSNGADKIGTMTVMESSKVHDAFNSTLNPNAGEYYAIGSYGYNDKLDEIINFDGEIVEVRNDYTPDEPAAEKGGTSPLPNADGSHTPENVPNADDRYKTQGVAGEDFNTENTYIIDGETGSSLPSEKVQMVAKPVNGYCYLFLPEDGSKWNEAASDECRQLQEQLIGLLDSVSVKELTVSASDEEYQSAEDSLKKEEALNTQLAEINAKIKEHELVIETYKKDLEEYKGKSNGNEYAETITNLEEELSRLNDELAELYEIQEELDGVDDELDTLQETQEKLSYIEKWAQAFCARDGAAIIEMSDEDIRSQLNEQQMLIYGTRDDGSEYASFGWSSPWPWSPDKDYRVISCTDSSAVILYYAWTSDPHVTVWREELGFEMKSDGIVINSENLSMLDAICTSEEFYKAYPDGIINDTIMDYTANGAGESFSREENVARQSLLKPDEAAIKLLNILDNPNKVKTEIAYYDDLENSAKVTFTFELDHTSVSVRMIQPYGKDGVWVPQTDASADDSDFYKISLENDDTVQGYVRKEYIDK